MSMWTQPDVEEAVLRVRERAGATFAADGRVSPLAFVFATKNPDTGAEHKHLMMVPPMGAAGVQQRQTYPLLIRLAALKGDAAGLVFVAEATARRGDGAQRVLMVVVEHLTFGIQVWEAPIGDDGLRDWSRVKGQVQSRFLHLLPKPDGVAGAKEPRRT